MRKVTIITGGAGGMGLATARVLGPERHLVLADLSQERLAAAAAQLQALGIGCETVAGDLTARASVDALFARATAAGPLASVIHAAGVSPQMASPEVIMRVNAVGTIHVTEASLAAASEGFVLVNVASMAGYMVPGWLAPTRAYRHAFTDPEAFVRKALFLTRLLPRGLPRTGLAYSVSKHFVIWYSQRCAGRFGEKGARILSVSPGSFETEMGRLEEKSGSREMLKTAALKRFGRPEEIAELLAFCASDKVGYLTGTDILCDGGVIASRRR